MMDSVEQLIRTGQPLSALQTLASHASLDCKPAALVPSGDNAAALQQCIHKVCLACYQDSKVRKQYWKPYQSGKAHTCDGLIQVFYLNGFRNKASTAIGRYGVSMQL